MAALGDVAGTQVDHASYASARAAVDGMYRLYASRVRRLCRRWIPDAALAEDAAQETFLRAFARFSTFDQASPPWPWLASIARHTSIDQLRGRRESVSLDEDIRMRSLPRSLVSTDESDHLLLRQTLAVAMHAVRPRERRLLWMHAVERRTWREIARADGASVDTVRNLAWRARTALRAHLEHVRPLLWLPVALAARAGLRLRRARDRMGASLGALTQEALVQGVFGVLMITSVALAPPIAATSRALLPRAQVAAEANRALAPEELLGLDPDPAAPHPPPVAPPNLPISRRLSWRPGGATPSSGRLRLEARGPDGTVLAGSDTGFTCDPRDRPLVGPPSPVTTAC